MVSHDPKPPLTEADKARVGLCARCRHARAITSSKGSTFWLCGRAETEPTRFRKYPPLPVVGCAGFEAKDPTTA